MKLYADTSVRRTLQIVGDLAVVLWVWFWVSVAHQVHDATLELATPGRKIDSSATDLAERLRDAGRTVAGVPLVGDDVRRPFDGAAGAANGLADAGQQQVAAVGSLANWLGLAVALIPILMLLWFYLPPASASYDAPPPASATSTPAPTSTCSRSGRWPTSRCTCWPASTPTRRARGDEATPTWSTGSRGWSCGRSACDRRPV